MHRNWLKYLGLLGFLGLLGLFTSNPGFYGFYGFFSFFSFTRIKNDERLEANANKSCRNAFLSSLFLFMITVIYATMTDNKEIFIFAFALNFAIQIIVFTFSLHFYDRVGE